MSDFFEAGFWLLPVLFFIFHFIGLYVGGLWLIKRYYSQCEAGLLSLLLSQATLAQNNPTKNTLAQQLANTLVKQLTPLQIERVLIKAVSYLKHQMQKPSVLKACYRIGDNWLPVFFERWSVQYFSNMEAHQRERLTQSMQGLYAQVFPHLKLDYPKAEILMDVLFSVFITPDMIRNYLLDGLSHLPAELVEKTIKQSLSGFPAMMVKFIDLKPVIESFKRYLIDSPDKACQQLIRIIDHLELREKLAERLSQINWERLRPEEQETVYHWINQFLNEWLLDDPKTLGLLVSSLLGGTSRLLIRLVLQTDWQTILTSNRLDMDKLSEPSLSAENADASILSNLSSKICHYAKLFAAWQLSDERLEHFSKNLYTRMQPIFPLSARQEIFIGLAKPCLFKLSFLVASWAALLAILSKVSLN